jgi:hypothetical protein
MLGRANFCDLKKGLAFLFQFKNPEDLYDYRKDLLNLFLLTLQFIFFRISGKTW